MLKKIILFLLAVFIIIQFIRPAKNLAARGPQHIEAIYPMPDNVKQIMRVACYDCHSDSTRYPWYNRVQPVAWWLNHHVDEAKGELNFSQFGTYSKQKQVKKLQKVKSSVTKGWMPLDSYLWIHKDAKLSPEQAKAIADWADQTIAQIP
ncbi:MAG: heme-binding domain-containing protein [Bacteroidetes bacterium]|nr:heme-binding domain-containing protein [Bacteroidota bacterium]